MMANYVLCTKQDDSVSLKHNRCACLSEILQAGTYELKDQLRLL